MCDGKVRVSSDWVGQEVGLVAGQGVTSRMAWCLGLARIWAGCFGLGEMGWFLDWFWVKSRLGFNRPGGVGSKAIGFNVIWS